MEQSIPHIEISDEPEEVLRDTHLTDDPVRDYLDSISKVPLLNAELEVELAKRIEAGLYAAHLLLQQEQTSLATVEELEWIVNDGEEAKKNFLEANPRLVVSIAKKYNRFGASLELLDLIQEGNEGLIRAVEKFDYTKGYKFSTYASWWIRQAITRGIAQKSRTIRIPVHAHEQLVAMNSASRFLEMQGIDPTPETLAEEMDISVDKVQEMMNWSHDTISLETPLGETSDESLGSILEIEENSVEAMAEYSEMRDKLLEAIEKLGEREEKIIKMHFGLNGTKKNLKDIGAEIGVSHERVRQLLGPALQKLSTHEGLRLYIDTKHAS